MTDHVSTAMLKSRAEMEKFKGTGNDRDIVLARNPLQPTPVSLCLHVYRDHVNLVTKKHWIQCINCGRKK